MMSRLLCALALLLTVTFSGCGRHESSHDGHSHVHVHTAPHGGTLVALGSHAYNLELVPDAAAGKLTAYILDGHAENFIRIKAPAFEAVATVNGEQRPLVFKAVANTATGETVGDTSQFEAEADWLKSTASFAGVVTTLDIRGNTFTSIAFKFPQ